jgi:hypothetical protein
MLDILVVGGFCSASLFGLGKVIVSVADYNEKLYNRFVIDRKLDLNQYPILREFLENKEFNLSSNQLVWKEGKINININTKEINSSLPLNVIEQGNFISNNLVLCKIFRSYQETYQKITEKVEPVVDENGDHVKLFGSPVYQKTVKSENEVREIEHPPFLVNYKDLSLGYSKLMFDNKTMILTSMEDIFKYNFSDGTGAHPNGKYSSLIKGIREGHSHVLGTQEQDNINSISIHVVAISNNYTNMDKYVRKLFGVDSGNRAFGYLLYAASFAAVLVTGCVAYDEHNNRR